MITCFTGTPGGGKTYAAIVEMVRLLREGRTVYTNVDGHDKEKCRRALGYVAGAPEGQLDGRLVYMDKATTLHFWEVVPNGAVVVLDEVHKIWSSRTYASEGNKAFAEWCSTHRHTGNDVILITQALDKLDGHVRSLIEWTHRCRKVNFLGKMVKRSYLEYVYSEDDERNCLHKGRKTYEPVYFKCYESYAAKDIKEKGIGKPTNILRHPVFYAIPVVFAIMIYMIFFKSSIGKGDVFGSKSYQKSRAAAFQKAGTGEGKPVDLNKGDGYYEKGKWVAAPKPAEVKKDGPGDPAKVEGPGAVASVPKAAPGGVGYVYHPPAKVVKEGDTWRFFEQGTGREIGYVKWVNE
jgi:zona occludens toxin (predicted ATPase)